MSWFINYDLLKHGAAEKHENCKWRVERQRLPNNWGTEKFLRIGNRTWRTIEERKIGGTIRKDF